MSSGSFTGSLSLSGTDAASFQIVGSVLETVGSLSAGTYHINIIATQGGAGGSPFTAPETLTGSPGVQNFTGNQVLIPFQNGTTSAVVGGQLNQTPIFGLLAPTSPSATITLDANWQSNVTDGIAPNHLLGYWMIDGIQIGAVINTGSGSDIHLTFNSQTVSWNGGTGIPDGPHVATFKAIDSADTNGWLAAQLTCVPLRFILANSGFNNGAQLVPVCSLGGNYRPYPPEDSPGTLVDFVSYSGTPPSNTARPYKWQFIPPAYDTASPWHATPANLRIQSNWYPEASSVFPHWIEYTQLARLGTTPSGGVMMQGSANQEPGTSVEQQYPEVLSRWQSDGGRLAAFVDAISTLMEAPTLWSGVGHITGNTFTVESTTSGALASGQVLVGLGVINNTPIASGGPTTWTTSGPSQTVPSGTLMHAWEAGGPYWTGIDLAGRIFKQALDGTVTTIAGNQPRSDRLFFNQWDSAITENQYNTQQKNIIGNIVSPTFGDFNGLNDLCYDPRNRNIIYVVKALDHFIIKIDLSTSPPTCSRYAGQDGTAGYNEGAATSVATFRRPYSIVMADRTMPNGDLTGTMYVADKGNSAIRRINPAGTTVDTLCGGTAGPANPPSDTNSGETTMGATTTVNCTLTFSSYDSGIGASVVTVAASSATDVGAAPATTGVGFSVTIAGVTGNTGADGPGVLNGSFFVRTWSSTTSFTINVPSTNGGVGTISGSPITITSNKFERWSLPAQQSAVGFATAATVFPQAIRFTSDRQLILLEDHTGPRVREICLGTTTAATALGETPSTIRTIRAFRDSANTTGGNIPADPYYANGGNGPVYVGDVWAWMLVDDAGGVLGRTIGACGVLDDIRFLSQNGPGSAEAAWMCSRDGVYVGPAPVDYDTSVWDSRPGKGGHYPWIQGGPSITQARFTTGGMADNGVYSQRPVLPTDPNVQVLEPGRLDNVIFELCGLPHYQQGTPLGFPNGVRPGLQSVHGPQAISLVGVPNAEDLMDMFPSTTPGDAGDVALGRYIQAGMGGRTPRGEFNGNDLRDIIYWLRRQTLAGSGGYPPSFAAPIEPGPWNTDYTPPVVSAVSATRLSNTSIQVAWQTDKISFGIAVGGSPNSQAPATDFYGLSNRYPCASPMGGNPAAITSITWATGTATIVTAAWASDGTATPPTANGDIVNIAGVANSSSAGNAAVNGNFTITSFTDNRHFQVAMPGTGIASGSGIDAGPMSAQSGRTMQIAGVYTTLHSAVITNLPDVTLAGRSPTHFNIICKSAAGGWYPILLSSAVWTNTAGGQLTVVLDLFEAPPSPSVGTPVQLINCTNTGSGGDQAVNGTFTIYSVGGGGFTWVVNMPAGPGVIGTVGDLGPLNRRTVCLSGFSYIVDQTIV